MARRSLAPQNERRREGPATYQYPGSAVLRNKLDIRDAKALDFAERMLVRQRMGEGCPGGDFDLTPLQVIHRHLFQGVYEWAGETRQVPLAKGDSHFFPPNRIGLAMPGLPANGTWTASHWPKGNITLRGLRLLVPAET